MFWTKVRPDTSARHLGARERAEAREASFRKALPTLIGVVVVLVIIGGVGALATVADR